MPQLEVRGFPLGITDDVETQNPKEYVEADNLTIDYPSSDLVSRGGSIIRNEVTPRITEQRISNLINYGDDDELLAISEAKLFHDTGLGGIVEIQGPTGNQAFAGSSSNMIGCPAEHDDHLYIACDDDDVDGCLPVKVYKNEDGELTLITAGLPKMEYSFPISTTTSAFTTLANEIRTRFLSHYANVTSHPTGADTVSAALITAPALNIGDSLETVIILVNQLMAAYQSHHSDAARETGSRLYHSNALGEKPGTPIVSLYDESEPITYQDVALRLNDLARRHNWHIRAYRAHPSPYVVGDTVSTAAIPGCNDPYQADTFFQDVNYDELIDIAVELHDRFLSHKTDQTSLGKEHLLDAVIDVYSTTQTLDTENATTISTATDLESLIELVAQLYGAIRDHVADGTYPSYRFDGTATDPANKDIYQSLVQISDQGRFQDIETGMYLGTGAVGGLPPWPPNTKVISKLDPNVTVDKNNTAFLLGTVRMLFTKSKYHIKINASGTNIPQADIDLMTPSGDITIGQIVNNIDFLESMLIDLVEKYNFHDGPTNLSGVLHESSFRQQVNIEETIPTTPQDVRHFIYGFVFRRTYITSDGLTREDISSTFLKTKFALRTIEDSPTIINLGQLKTIVNGGTLNYDTANTYVDIYRTKDRGLTLFKVGSAPLGSSSFIDTISDADLDSKQPLYTTGGVVDNDPPPIARVIHSHLGIGYYGNLKVGDEYFPNQISQSIPGDIDSVPETFNVNLPRPVVGISSTPRDVIGWTKSGTYRIEGTFDERGQGGITVVPISEQIGLFGGISPVQVDQGVVFAGSDGFYITDGYTLTPLANRFQETYSQLVTTATRARRIQGTYDKFNQTVLWTCSFSDDENDIIFVLHLAFGVGAHGGSFTTWSGGGSFRPSAITMFDGKLIRGDSRGYILEHNQNYSDPFIDPDVDPSEWVFQPIVFDYVSGAFDFGTRQIRKWVTKIITLLYNVGKTTFLISRINDFGKSIKACSKIEFSGVPVGVITEKRFFPAGNLRCTVMQVRMTNEADGQNDEKTRISSYSIKYEPLGDSFSDRDDDAAEIASAGA